MNDIGKTESATQDRVIRLFHDELGNRFVGNWTSIVRFTNSVNG
jgi:hypothetical protein